jgi:hypothetical protein
MLLYGGLALALLEGERAELDALCAAAAAALSVQSEETEVERGGRCSQKLQEILRIAKEFELAASKFGTPEDQQHCGDAQRHLRMGQRLLALRPYWRENQQWRLEFRHQFVTSLRGLPVLGSLLAPVLRPQTLCTLEAISWLRWQQWQTRWMCAFGRVMHLADLKDLRRQVQQRIAELQQRKQQVEQQQQVIEQELEQLERALGLAPNTKDTKTTTTTTTTAPPPPPSPKE